jgi:hypothetical protein
VHFLLFFSRFWSTKTKEFVLQATDRKASETEKKTGASAAETLQNLIRPYFLRREKKDIYPPKAKAGGAPAAFAEEDGTISTEKPTIGMLNTKKEDLVVWLQITPQQLDLYNAFLLTDEVKNVRKEWRQLEFLLQCLPAHIQIPNKLQTTGPQSKEFTSRSLDCVEENLRPSNLASRGNEDVPGHEPSTVPFTLQKKKRRARLV